MLTIDCTINKVHPDTLSTNLKAEILKSIIVSQNEQIIDQEFKWRPKISQFKEILKCSLIDAIHVFIPCTYIITYASF